LIHWRGKEVYRCGAMGLCLPLMAADKDKEEFEKTKSKAEKG
jgi:hypothetical protein